ncbi:MAG: hypothetical protein JXA30_02345 [Deltaproteobacteria bacterium]|nr:hypothetical protein [Deltaproteobacteria bacterium]
MGDAASSYNNLAFTNPFKEYGTWSGTWTEAPTYSATNFRTTFTDVAAQSGLNGIEGKLIQPDQNSPHGYYIVDSSATTIEVWRDLTREVFSGATYRIYDLRSNADSERLAPLAGVRVLSLSVACRNRTPCPSLSRHSGFDGLF